MTNYKCKSECLESGLACSNSTCRHHISYDEDLNCSLISIDKNGDMTLQEISKRMGLSLVRIKQIEEKALAKINKKNKNLFKEILHE